MIWRIWRGWTSSASADEDEHLLNTTIVPGITARRIPGHRGTEILRERDPQGAEVQFVTIMTFDGWDAVREFAGGDGPGSVGPPAGPSADVAFRRALRPLRCLGQPASEGTDPGEIEPAH